MEHIQRSPVLLDDNNDYEYDKTDHMECMNIRCAENRERIAGYKKLSK